MEKHENMMGKKKKKLAQLGATINYGTQVRFHFGMVRMSLIRYQPSSDSNRSFWKVLDLEI